MNYSIFSWLRRLVLGIFVITAFPVFASDHGGGSPVAGAGETLQFTVNIGNSTSIMRFLQVTMAFELANSVVAARFSAIKPKAQHHIILRLASEDVAELQTIKGKMALQEQIAADLNNLLDETSKTGVKDVMFTSFIIQ
jgi:flagellar FliL protein